jgi:hypothetical protein
MAQSLNITNTLGKVVTLQNPDTNASDITVDIDKLVVKDSAGNVGIGINPITSSLPTVHSHYGMFVGTSEVSINLNTYYNNGWKYITSAPASQIYNNGGNYYWKMAPTGTAGNTATLVDVMTLDVLGNLLLKSGTGGLGYGTGAGGTVTQLTSKGTTVTLNKPTGQIVTHNQTLAAGAEVTFALFNSLITANDMLIAHHNEASGTADPSAYRISTVYTTTGAARITIKNVSAGSLSEPIPINFTIIKGATA